MKRRQILTAITLLATFAANAQVGIGKDSPKASLDIAGVPSNPATADGIIAPKLTGDQLRAKNAAYAADQTGALIYVTAADTAPATKTLNVTAPGYYYFDGTAWQRFKQVTPIRTVTSSTTLATEDHAGFVYVSASAATTVTIPAALPAGFHCVIVQQGAGQVTIAGSGVTLTGARGTKTRALYSAVGVIKQTTAAGTITGDAMN